MHTEKPIRIAQIVGKLNAGGVEAVTNNYYRFMDHTQIQFDYIIDEDSNYKIPQDILDAGARYYIVPRYQNIFKYISALKKLFKENNYLIVHSNLTTMSVFSLYAAKKVGVPIRICHSHSTAGKGEFLKNVLKFILKPFSKKYATDCFACSEYAATWLFGKKYVKQGKVKIINNAIDLNKFLFNESIRLELRKDLGINDEFVVGHVGRFVPQKNHSFLVEVFKEFHKINTNSKLLLVGGGPLIDKIQDKVNKEGLRDCVIFAGIKENIEQYYQVMDAFLFPSNYEGLGMVAVEAQVAGLCVVASDVVPSEIAITNSIEFMSLKQSAAEWARHLYNLTNPQSRFFFNKECKFDIVGQAKELQDWYCKRIKSL